MSRYVVGHGCTSHSHSNSTRYRTVLGLVAAFLQAAVLWAFLAVPAQAETVFTTQTPAGEFTDGPYELGMKFQSAVPGKIKAIRYWKASNESGSGHTGHLWDASGKLLATVDFANVDNGASGWQEQSLATPVTIQANTTYLVSVNSVSGYAATTGGLAASIVNGNLNSVADGANGVFGNPGIFPSQSSNNSNYFRDVVFEANRIGQCISGEKFVSVNGSGGPFVRNSVTSNNPNTGAANPLIASIPGTNNQPAETVNIPTAFFGGTKVFYQFKITNCGDVDLYNVRFDDCADLRSVGAAGFLQGGANGNCVENPRLVPPSRTVANKLPPGQSVTVTSATFTQDPISTIDMCEAFGRNRTNGIIRNDSQVEADADLNGDGTGETFVFFDDLNLVQCKVTPQASIALKKQISVDGGSTWADADTATAVDTPKVTAPSGALYRLIVKNTGNVDLKNVLVSDPTLGLTDVLIPGGVLAVNQEVTITSGTSGFSKLSQPNRCNLNTIGTLTNVATVTGTPVTGGTNVTASNPAVLICQAQTACVDGVIGGVDLGGIANKELFLFANGSQDANWQGATKGFAGNVVVDGKQAKERTSGDVPYAGTICTNDSTLSAWQKIVDQNAGQALANLGDKCSFTAQKVADQEAKLIAAFNYINNLTVTTGFESRSSTSLNGLNTQNGKCETFVINVTSGFQVSSKINITGDACDVFILRWDSDKNFGNGYQGQVKFQSGGAIVPNGGLKPGNFVHVAGDINSSGGGSNPPPPYPQGPRLNDGTGALINGGKDFSGGGFFTGYWLTTGAPATLDPASGLYIGNTASQSNGIFVGGWYTLTNKFSLTSGTSGVYVSPKCE
jgi:uncharacterized repeat protein (TIGR01451 family)